MTKLPSNKNPHYRFINLRGVELEGAETQPPVIKWRGDRDSEVVKSFEELPSTLQTLPKVFEDDIFAASAKRRAETKYFIHIDKDTSLESIVEVLPESGRVFYHLVFMIEEGCSFNYSEDIVGGGESTLVSGLAEFYLAKDAVLNISQAQRLDGRSKLFNRQYFDIKENAKVVYIPALCGGERSQVRTEAVCQEKGASFSTFGVVRGDGVQQFDFWATARHPVPDTTSQTEFWSVLGEKARAQFNGNLIIEPEGIHTDASQTSHNLMISDRAEMVTQPNLEIATDDVKCAHGAYIQSIDEEQIYYLTSRGISRNEARSMVINGFTDAVLAQMNNEDLRKVVASEFQKKKESE